MAKTPHYYYDDEACDFVLIEHSRKHQLRKIGGFVAGAVVLGFVFMFGIDAVYRTPEEVSLKAENARLQHELIDVGDRMDKVEDQLGKLVESDQNLYRSLLQANPISEDVLQVGVGGSDAYEEFSSYSPETASLLRQSASTLDKLERRIALQTASYKELLPIAEMHKHKLAEMPAILPADGPVVSGFGKRMHPILKIVRPHNGIDILVPQGTPVFAPGDGVIKDAGRGGGLGNFVRIEHSSTGYVTTFAHLSEIAGSIKRGVTVKRGDVIGLSGNTGLSKAPHLHYEVRDAKGKPFNPVYFFAPSMTPHEYQSLLASTAKGTTSLD
ncbi:MAG: M23 family metallopeptidase [Bacteroidetes bacterium]|nr:M23 family metallopeptidase [Bacteroidota bacterium]